MSIMRPQPTVQPMPPLPPRQEGCCKSQGEGHHSCCHGGLGKKIIMTLVAVLAVYLIFFLGAAARNQMKKYDFIGRADRLERTITVNGFGKVTGDNDIAVTSIGFSNTDKDVSKAQAENKKVMDKVAADLKALGIADKDLQTDYSIYPDYNYTQDKGQELKGYRVSNHITVKIRDLSKVSAVLGLAGKYGATEVGGLSFTIDDPENLKLSARDKALADAKAKARKLAMSLGVELVGVVSYNEYESNGVYYPMKAYSMDAGGLGGGASPAPEIISSGSRDVSMNVSVTYEIVSR